MNIEMIKAHVRTIPDFPKPGILFRDITTVYKDAACLQELTNSLTDYYKEASKAAVTPWRPSLLRN